MRFLENGPNIPSRLIQDRALGNVIFFCGAGISRYAGLPDFGGLTKGIISKLGADKAKKSFEANEGFDRAFSALVEEFGWQEIDRQIYRALKTPKKPKLDRHKVILSLSQTPAGAPQIVTTNFDLLFEKADRNIRRFVPPSLPDISLGDAVQGVVYLHGRLAEPGPRAKAGYIISSADFGRAYLAEGWAARFVRALRERYTLVLVGYSANDPPMRYLLEGLYSREQTTYSSPIYAFASGNPSEVEEEWRARGVTPISYDRLDADHSGLWDTLSAWADAARDQEGWLRKLLAFAADKPSQLKSYQRGQVAHLVSNTVGAKLFAEALAIPPAEWLCVFDRHVRFSKPFRKTFDDVSNDVDPLGIFGLDDDPPRPDPDPRGEFPAVGIDFIGWMSGDTAFPDRLRLAAWHSEGPNHLPERLLHLARWFGRICHEPVAVWWASSYPFLHGNILLFLNHRLRAEADFPIQPLTFWQLYLESNRILRIDEGYSRWFEFKNILPRSGWTPYVFREFERLIEPRVAFSRHSSLPPRTGWEELDLADAVSMTVRVLDRQVIDIVIPDDQLQKVVGCVRRSLERMSDLLGEIGTQWWYISSLHPTGNRDELFLRRKEKFFLWFVNLFQRLRTQSAAEAKKEMNLWNFNDHFFFGKLFIFVQAYSDLATGKDAAQALTKIDERVFFDDYNQRDLLLTLRSRWSDFDVRERRRLERKIINGVARNSRTKLANYRRRKAANAASILGWLELNGCNLTPVTASLLPKLKAADKRWNDEWARTADRSRGITGGFVETVTDLRGLDSIPICQIVGEAIRRTEDRHGELRHFRPFEGLVKSFPLKALSALRWEAKRSNYPTYFWQNLLSDWPNEVPPRLQLLAAHTFAGLPKEVAIELGHYLPTWIQKNLKDLAVGDFPRALAVFDAVLSAYVDANAEATESGVGTSTIGGVPQVTSQVSYVKAINSPIGILTETLFSMVPEASPSMRLPEFLSQRLDLIFRIPGNGAGHGVCITAARTGWLDHCYHDWVISTLVPLFSLSDSLSEGAWHGLASDQNGLSRETLQALNSQFLSLMEGRAPWKLDKNAFDYHIHRLVFLSRKLDNTTAIISFAQARNVLMALDSEGRAQALVALSFANSSREEWKNFVKPFIVHAWPRHLRYRSEETSMAFVRLLDGIGDEFPDGVKTILPYLTPIRYPDSLIYRAADTANSDPTQTARKFPRETLVLLDALIANDHSSPLYGLPRVLEIIADAAPSLRQSGVVRRLRDLGA